MMRTPRFIQLQPLDDTLRLDDVLADLKQPEASVSPKYFYDVLGSRLFEAITALEEYYPTRTEAAIFGAHASDMAQRFRARAGTGFDLIDLGAGSCAKAASLFDAFGPRRYIAIDISADFLRQSLECLQRAHPAMDMLGVGFDFSARLDLPDTLYDGPALVFYPGSSIGNFAPPDARRLLAEACAATRGGGLLIGVDLVKDIAVLEAAYDDALGVTAAFNLNALRHLNRVAGTDFDVSDWRHVARFDGVTSRIEMHLEARRAVTVQWSGGGRRFAEGERIHTENSYKWTPAAFETLLHEAGFGEVSCWTDAQRWFGVFLALPA
ncbi:MAG: L-histidine N(alpha)-methyltransferase [Methyloversatilis sp.]|nr:L-histidine N(alpha)-methyltransferase [Methyloversatilis sp.]MBP6194936.1 L-histidine N(alpha)-methyltransferase [Methyloversatilis sp.]MBP9117452.1 L-histidine N(alpha)-methyltransferase [Methyloversatilis sp.]